MPVTSPTALRRPYEQFEFTCFRVQRKRNIRHKDTVPGHQFKHEMQIEEMQELTLHIESEETVYDKGNLNHVKNGPYELRLFFHCHHDLRYMQYEKFHQV